MADYAWPDITRWNGLFQRLPTCGPQTPVGHVIITGVCEGLKKCYDLNLELRLGGLVAWSMATKDI